MKKSFLTLIALGLAATVPSAFATTYTYSTSGCFSGASVVSGSGTATTPTCNIFNFSDGGGSSSTLTFANQPSTVQNGFGTISLGTLTDVDTGSASGSVFKGNFSLTVTFTTPPGTSGNPFSAIISGNMFGSTSGYTLNFNPATVYFNDGNPADAFGLTISPNPVSPSSANSPLTLTAKIGAVPEPVSMGLLGGGLALLGLARWRRSAKKV